MAVNLSETERLSASSVENLPKMADNEDIIEVMADKEDEVMEVDSSEAKPTPAAKKIKKKAGPKSKTIPAVENAGDESTAETPAKKIVKKMGPKSKTMVKEVETFKISVKNVPNGVATESIRTEFTKFGKIGRCYKNVTLTEDSNQTFTVFYESLEEAQDAIMGMDGKEFQGQNLGVEMILEVLDQVDSEDAVENKENGDKSKSYFYSNTEKSKNSNGSNRGGKRRGQGPRGGGSEAHGTEGGPPYYCYNPACEHVQQFGECVRYKTPCKLADGSEPNNSNGPNRGGKTRGRGPRGGGESQGSGGGPPYHCYNPDCQHVQQFGECIRYKTPCKHADDSGPPIRGRNRGGGGPVSKRGGHTRDLRSILPPRLGPLPPREELPLRQNFGPPVPSRGGPGLYGQDDFGPLSGGRRFVEDYGPPPPPRIGPIGMDNGPPRYGGGPYGQEFGAPLSGASRLDFGASSEALSRKLALLRRAQQQLDEDYGPPPMERPSRRQDFGPPPMERPSRHQDFGPPSRSRGPFRQDFDLGPPSSMPLERPMYDEPSYSAGDEGGPPYVCANPACKFVQENGECVRYKSPCPNSGTGGFLERGFSGKFRGRGRGGMIQNRGQARGKQPFY